MLFWTNVFEVKIIFFLKKAYNAMLQLNGIRLLFWKITFVLVYCTKIPKYRLKNHHFGHINSNRIEKPQSNFIIFVDTVVLNVVYLRII